ncbi:MAG: hypothetical protein KQI35_10255 [Bacteroidetes bacterium]|nr:hypothetical protein [Bacteroidota bacterium]
MKYTTYLWIVITGIFLTFSSCQEDQYDMGDLTKPTNLTVNYQIVGIDAEHPNGDGSGLVEFTATASNAITYYFDFNDGKDRQLAPGGTITNRFSIPGLNEYNVVVYAVGTGGITSNTAVPVEVVSDFSDEEAVEFLTGGDSKSWYWAADQIGHLGLGPNNLDYEPGSHTFPQWYQAAPWEKSESSLYDCELVFTKDGGNVTFEQINPTGEAFIQGLYSEALGFGPEGSYPFDIEGVKNVIFSPSESIATIDGGYRGTTMTFSDGGFMGFYAGSSEYEIIEVTESILRVRMVQANEPLFAWYHIFTNVKPEQK